MIQLLTNVKIIDNSGGIIGRCIKILQPKNKTIANIGDIILISIQKSLRSSDIKKGELFKAIVVRSSSIYKDAKWSDNGVILLSSNLTPIGSRIKSGISRELSKKKGNKKYLSLAQWIL